MTSSVDFTESLGFPSKIGSPNYRPQSPELPIGLPKYPSNIQTIDEQRESHYDDSFLEIDLLPKRRKRKSNKQKAEEQFDANAAPVTLRAFTDYSIDESESLDIDIEKDEKVNIDNECKIDEKELAEQCAIVSLVIAQNNAPDEELDKELILNVDFPEDIVEVYYDAIGEDISKYDHREDITEIDPLKPNRKLFYERRLIQSIQLRFISSPEFIKTHFPVDEKLLSLSVRSMYNDDYNSWNIIKSKLQNICEDSLSLNSLFYGKDWIQKFSDLLIWKRSSNLQVVAICSYWLFFSGKTTDDRNLTASDLDHRLFGKTKFKYFSISELLSRIGINFITDFCAFPFYKDRIMNLFENSHYDIMDQLKIEKRVKRKKEKDEIKFSVIKHHFSVNNQFSN